jgi:hypothetical protein
MCVELQSTLDVDDALIARVQKRRHWYLIPDNSYPSLEAYIDATYATLAAYVRVYQAEVAAAEAAHRKPRRAELKAERASAPSPTPERAQPARASKQTRSALSRLGRCF